MTLTVSFPFLQEFFPALHELWAAPALIAVALWLLYGTPETLFPVLLKPFFPF